MSDSNFNKCCHKKLHDVRNKIATVYLLVSILQEGGDITDNLLKDAANDLEYIKYMGDVKDDLQN